MKKELFVESIKQLKKQYKFDEKHTKYASKIYPNAFEGNLVPDNHWVTNALIKILQVEFNDNHRDSWIEYYIWELDFGKKYREGCASRKDGSNIVLSTPSALYDFLIEDD